MSDEQHGEPDPRHDDAEPAGPGEEPTRPAPEPPDGGTPVPARDHAQDPHTAQDPHAGSSAAEVPDTAGAPGPAGEEAATPPNPEGGAGEEPGPPPNAPAPHDDGTTDGTVPHEAARDEAVPHDVVEGDLPAGDLPADDDTAADDTAARTSARDSAERGSTAHEPSAHEPSGQESAGDDGVAHGSTASGTPEDDTSTGSGPGPEPAGPGHAGSGHADTGGAESAVVDDPPPGGTRRLWQVFRPGNRRAEYITAALCVAFGFALAVQVAQSTGDQLASLRQDELVRLLDEVTQRGEQLDTEVANLTRTRDDLRSADGQDRAAREVAEQRAEYEGILSGRLPAEGPGVVIEIQAGPGTVSAANMFNMLEELRNAGVEAQQLNDVRIVTSSHFEETVDEQHRILLDGRLLEPPYTWVAIGDPETVDRALEIPGGALPTLRDAGATANVERKDLVSVDATRMPSDPENAVPSEE
ncbi:DUF881 domain-containing protein [Myceligenerans indicum]|uniref:DUF881 domain-containing protein n=1 Tax=Myceligenerans indicum TaxID=2593663 RepID=A0ABS1LN93_9MICO|nr:DUF881 domain-containing protein [Myceligenerans indicum]MBL0887726.1 DUF881 domain-containing protein [Myceligenerans indicum]